jgi:hypothetical protein
MHVLTAPMGFPKKNDDMKINISDSRAGIQFAISSSLAEA